MRDATEQGAAWLERRIEWLRRRRDGLGSSDIARICNISPFGGPLDVYLEKLGLKPDRPTRRMQSGLLMEDVIAARYEEEQGRPLTKPEPYTIVAHPDHPWWLATPDRHAPDRVVELKNVASDRDSSGEVIWGPSGSDLAPIYYVTQLMWQLPPAGVPRGDIACYLAGWDLRVYHFEWHQQLLDRLQAIAESFWARVVNRDQPPLDWTDPRTPELLALLHQPQQGKRVELDGEAEFHADQYEMLGQQISELAQYRDRVKGRLIELMADAEEALLPDGRRVRRKAAHRKQYTVEASEYVDFRILQPKKERNRR